jgi:hypothetical protein
MTYAFTIADVLTIATMLGAGFVIAFVLAYFLGAWDK